MLQPHFQGTGSERLEASTVGRDLSRADMLVPILAGDLQIAYLTYHPDV
jgi:hypothetical protein